MKYDLESKSNKFAQRTLTAFSTTLFDLLEKEPLEKISVNKICEISNYPRATFYNYFEDIYDLLNYCFESMANDINFESYHNIKEKDRLYVLFEYIYDYVSSYVKKFEKIMKHNTFDGVLVDNFRKFLRVKILEVMDNCSHKDDYGVPYELLAEHYSNMLQLVIIWSFCREEKLSKNQAIKYLKCLSKE